MGRRAGCLMQLPQRRMSLHRQRRELPHRTWPHRVPQRPHLILLGLARHHIWPHHTSRRRSAAWVALLHRTLPLRAAKLLPLRERMRRKCKGLEALHGKPLRRAQDASSTDVRARRGPKRTGTPA